MLYAGSTFLICYLRNPHLSLYNPSFQTIATIDSRLCLVLSGRLSPLRCVPQYAGSSSTRKGRYTSG